MRDPGGFAIFYLLRTRLTFTFIVLLIIPFITMVAVLTRVSNAQIGKSIEESTSQTMDQYASFVSTLTTQVEDVANQVLSSEVTQQWVGSQLDEHETLEKRLALDAEMRKYLSSIALNHTYISSIALFNEDGSAIGIRDQAFRDPSFLQSAWYADFRDNGVRWVPAHLDPYQPTYLQRENVNSLIFNLVQLSTFRNIGLLKVNVLASQIQKPLDKIKFGESGKVYLVDKDGLPVLNQSVLAGMSGFRSQLPSIWESPWNGGKLTVRQQGEEHLVLFRKIKNANWLLVGEVPKSELFENMQHIQQTMMAFGALLLLLTMIAAFWLSSGIARPLSRLAAAMRQVERADFHAVASPEGLDAGIPRNEVGYVVQVFRNMVSRLNYLIKTEFQANMRRKDAEYKALLMQINPHFLYNTLEAIGSLAVQDRKNEVIDVTERLGLMMRYSLRTDSDLARLSEEMAYIRDYAAIMTVRFRNRLRLDIDDKPELGSEWIVKFILQPLVENAVKFGLENEEGARVAVTVRKEAGFLEVAITDNGPGMPQALIDELMRERASGKLTEVLSASGGRIGLRNALARCYLHYGDQFGIRIESAQGSGTAIRIRIPVKGEALDVQRAAGG